MVKRQRKANGFMQQLTMRNYVFLIFLFLMLLVSVGSIIGNLVTNFPMIANVKWLVAILLSFVGFYCIKKNMFLEPYKAIIFLLLLFIVVWPSWWYGGGDNAITMLYMLVILVQALLVFESILFRWLIVVLTAVSCISMLIITYRMPHLVQPTSQQDVFVDSVIQVTFIFVITIISIHIFMAQYKRQQKLLMELNERLEKEANYDALANVFRRRKVMEMLEEALNSTEIKCIHIFMIDIDFFKHINDEHGHLVGDEVIRHFAAHLRQVAEECGVIGRYGGDEFMIFTVNQSDEQIKHIAEQIKNIPSYQEIPLTMSGGVAKVVGKEEVDFAVEKADKLLFESKREGKNRITLWNGEIITEVIQE